ncbi:hypothetical protein [Ktedonobacter robiniae]|uniref:hypothetical protein n=1 Tax=Ktedonobacter robiniae TaxID=2778365 RepID=UPI00191540BB|nr:hypothetical protein [Ktedonobacter robiniae]
MSKNTSWFVLCATACCLLWSSILLTACGSQAPEVRGKNTPHTIARDNIEEKHATPTPDTPLQAQATTPTPTPTQKPAGAAGGPTNIPATGSGAAPYGSPPGLTALEQQLTQQLFNQINSDRAARGLYAYQWNTTLAGEHAYIAGICSIVASAIPAPMAWTSVNASLTKVSQVIATVARTLARRDHQAHPGRMSTPCT